jgi:Domain of unknown function (DUF4345)
MSAKRGLQIVTALLCVIPMGTGLISMMGVADPLYAGLAIPKSPLLDSNMRFFGGVWLALGLGLAWTIPSIDTRTAVFRVIWFAVFVGGIGRLLSMFISGTPPVPFVVFTALEIIGAPLFVLWQRSVARGERASLAAETPSRRD